ncbi:squalene/phytoene synthase family protein [Akkermansiaceae bacterium]|nr:squalene/phytoene synthase family protein [Akkermansiaceae bacterium]
MSSSAEITRKAKSNLALAFVCLPKDRKRDMITFYAFCRVIDDLADDLDIPLEDRVAGLDEWREGLKTGFSQPDELQSEIISLIERYDISKQPFLDLIDGCSSDLHPQRFDTWEDLQSYTYCVASCVGVISTRIFGCTHPDSEKYAVALGHALQLTNILRDIDEDLSNGGRVYLPLDDLTRFNYSEQDLINRVHDERFTAMMTYQADRADALYAEAIALIQPEDTKALKAAEAMRKIYYGVLKKMRSDNFQVFEQRYSLSKPKKMAILLSTIF